MDENKSPDYVLIIMKNLNFIIIVYISIIMAYSLSGYIQENSAWEFLLKIDSIPTVAWKIPMMTICLYCSCLILMYMDNVNNFGLALKVSVEIGISFFISYILSFSYTGIILLILADTMKYFQKSERKFLFAIIICLFYLIIDFNLLSIWCDVIPLEVYLEYFQNNIHSILLGVKNIITSLNIFIFIVYMILLVRIQMSEKEKVLSLNAQLNIINAELHQANIRLKEYAKESEKTVQIKERNRLAREIHDTIGHALTGIMAGLEASMVLMDKTPESAKKQLKAIYDVAKQGMTDVRRSVKALRPDALDKLNLEEALIQIIDEICSATNTKIDYQCKTKLNCFDNDEEDIIYRIVQECITNSIRHGKADKIQIRINKECNMLKIYIRDNGIGCKDIKKGFGLYHMEERLNMLQGSLNYKGEDGFIVEAKIPIRFNMEERKDD